MNPVSAPESEKEADLSFSQKRLWFIDQLEGPRSHYNLSTAINIVGNLDREALRNAFAEIVNRHEVLRTNYRAAGGGVIRTLRPAHVFSVDEIDHSRGADQLSERETEQLIAQEAKRPFNLAEDPMLRVTLVRLIEAGDKSEFLLLLTLHHITADAWSIKLLIQEFKSLYLSTTQQTESRLPALPMQYADYAKWQKQRLQGDRFDRLMDYWKKQLRNIPSVHQLPLDKPRPARQTYEGRRYIQYIEPELTQPLKDIARKNRATLFIVLQSAFSVLLSRFGGERDVVMGVPVAGRTHRELQSLIGFFINTLVFRTGVDPEQRFSELLKCVRNTSLDALEHQDVPFEMLVEQLKPERSLSYSPLFQILFSMTEHNADLLALPGLELTLAENDCGRAKVDLELDIVETNRGLKVNWVFATSLFEASSIERMARYFASILKRICLNPDAAIVDLYGLLGSDKERLLEWNQTQVSFPEPNTLVEMLEEQLRKTPERTALIFTDTEVTYAQLHRQANQLAHYLVDNFRVRAGQLIGLCMERSAEMIVGLLAIVKSGGAFVPLEPELPTSRLAYMAEDSGVELILVQPTTRDCLSGVAAVAIDVTSDDYEDYPDSPPRVQVSPQQTAYAIYTSGSTGQPKGTLNRNSGICNRLRTLQHQFSISADDRVLQKTPLSFDVSVGEIFWPLTMGATLVLPKAQGHKAPAYLAALIKQRQVSIIHFVPSMLQIFLRVVDVCSLSSLRLLMTSGEALSYELQKQAIEAFNGVELVNQYGPTEAAIDVSYWCFNALRDDKKVPIGRPAANVRLFVLDERQQAVPIGVEGELYIAGCQVGDGYLGRDDMTAERFIEVDVLGTRERMYRTGDRVRWLADGNIEYLGRLDGQVKLRGMRVELGEIEAQIRGLKGVADAIVALTGSAENQTLIAYVLPDQKEPSADCEDNPLSVERLRQSLTQNLPLHMLPSHFHLLDAFPVSANGKVDRRALPQPQTAARPYQGASNAVEKVLIEIWSQELRVSKESIGVNDNFFEIGGNSLNIIPICSEINKRLGQSVAIANMFQYPSIAHLSGFINKTTQGKRQRSEVGNRKNRILLARKKSTRK